MGHTNNASLPITYLHLNTVGAMDLTEKLGSGRLADVYLGHLRQPYQKLSDVAVKIARSDINEEQRRSFDKEADTLRRMAKAAPTTLDGALPFPRLLDSDPANATGIGTLSVVVLEFISGNVLAEILNQTDMQNTDRNVWLLKAAGQYAQLLDILHRANLTCSDRKLDDLRWEGDEKQGRLIVLDWNVVAEGKAGIPRDLEIFGQFWYELATGAKPAFVTPVSRQPVYLLDGPSAASAWNNLSDPLKNLLRRSLHPVPEHRFRTAEELSCAIRSVQEGQTVDASPGRVNWRSLCAYIREDRIKEAQVLAWDVIGLATYGSPERAEAARSHLWINVAKELKDKPRALSNLFAGSNESSLDGAVDAVRQEMSDANSEAWRWLDAAADISNRIATAKEADSQRHYQDAVAAWGKALDRQNQVRNDVTANYTETSRRYCAWDDIAASGGFESLAGSVLDASRRHANEGEPIALLRRSFEQALAGGLKTLKLAMPIAVAWSGQKQDVKQLGEELYQLAENWATISGCVAQDQLGTAIKNLCVWEDSDFRRRFGPCPTESPLVDSIVSMVHGDASLNDLVGKVTADTTISERRKYLFDVLQVELPIRLAARNLGGVEEVVKWLRSLGSQGELAKDFLSQMRQDEMQWQASVNDVLPPSEERTALDQQFIQALADPAEEIHA